MFNLNSSGDVVLEHISDLREIASSSPSARWSHDLKSRRLGRWIGRRLIAWGTSLGGMWPEPSVSATEGGTR